MFILPDLPYGYDALEPSVSQTTMRTHHDKHHKTYVDNTNKMLEEAGSKPASLEAVIRSADGDASKKKLFNNAAQAWNHAFFWECMTPAKHEPSESLTAAIDRAFGSKEELKKKFVEEGAGHFASGWAWLVIERGELKVISTHDAATTVTMDAVTPLLVCDVWEHAYYLDYKNDRKSFLEKWFDTVANWAFASDQFAAALGEGEPYRYPAPQGAAGEKLAEDQDKSAGRPAGQGGAGAVHT